MFKNFFKYDPCAEYSADLEVLRQNLFSNLYQDVFYGNFPEVPTGLKKETHHFGPYSVKQITQFQDSSTSLVVKYQGEWLGTLQLIRKQKFQFTLPENIKAKDAAKTLVYVLNFIQDEDANNRTQKTNVYQGENSALKAALNTEPSVETPKHTDNIIRFPDGGKY